MLTRGSLAVQSVLLGIGLSMDAFSVSLANGLQESTLTRKRMYSTAAVFAVFQCGMPMIGWACVTMMAQYLIAFERYIPWIACGLLTYVGGRMLIGGLRDKPVEPPPIGWMGLVGQGVATSLDALSVGFTIAGYSVRQACTVCVIIGAVTWGICVLGVKLGRTLGMKLSGKAECLGGCILMAVGLKIAFTA